jgi:hypothetical protein
MNSQKASMSPSSKHRRLIKSLLGFAAIQAVALALAAMLALTLHGPWARGARTPTPVTPALETAPAIPKPAPAQILGPSALDNLRVDTSIGDFDAGRLLVASLLDRYDGAGDMNDLFEAVQWIDRGWASGQYQQSGLATRIFERHCGQRVLRWHWLCDVGE